MGALSSVDSSGPVFAGLMGHQYTTDADSLQLVKKLKMPVDFNISMTKDSATINRIQTNVNLTLALFNNLDVGDKWYAQE
jgi:hypothetical protein